MALYKVGSKGAEVKNLQNALIKAGYNVGKSGADGIYGSNTANAVRAYQKAKGLSTDGIAGKNTLGALGLYKTPSSTPTTTGAPPVTTSGGFKFKEFDPTAKNYKGLATKQYEPSFVQKETALKNKLAEQLAAFDTQKTGIHGAYDKKIDNQNLYNKLAKNQYSDETLSRGLGRSTIHTTNIGAMDMRNKRMIGDIDAERVASIADIENMARIAKSGTASEIADLQSQKQNLILTLARELEDRDFTRHNETQDRLFKSHQQKVAEEQAAREFAFKQEQAKIQQEFQRQQLELQKQQLAQAKAAASRSYSSYTPYSSSSKSNTKSKAANQTKTVRKINAANATKLQSQLKTMMNDPKTSKAQKLKYMQDFVNTYSRDPNMAQAVQLAKNQMSVLNRSTSPSTGSPKGVTAPKPASGNTFSRSSSSSSKSSSSNKTSLLNRYVKARNSVKDWSKNVAKWLFNPRG